MRQGWEILPADTAESLSSRITDAFQRRHDQCFHHSQAAHPGLSIELRELQQYPGWWLGHLLTPVALYRICLPTSLPDAALPADWTAVEQQSTPCSGLGPLLPLRIPKLIGQAHLQYLPELGHFLLQPEVQSLLRYPDADAVFAAWGQVTSFRKMTRMKLEKQQQCDRRAFLRRILPVDK
ncbi:MAG: hypothetical protein P4L77_01455 [Sulfuriferula sp.]|nr:hypothetical protein [Sulfuriferula sp.]